MTQSEAQRCKEAFLGLHKKWVRESSRNGAAWLQPIREAAIARFDELGFPTPRIEEWKHTNVAPLTRHEFIPAMSAPTKEVEARLDEFTFGDLESHRLVFVNGRFSSSLSRIGSLPSNVILSSLNAAVVVERKRTEAHFGRYAKYENHPFVALNTAFVSDGAFVYVPRDTVLDHPVHLVFVTVGGQERPIVTQPRNLIVAESGSRMSVVESYVSTGDSTYFTNVVTELFLGDHAVGDHYHLQMESPQAFHIASQQVFQERDSDFSTHVISTGSALNRNDLGNVLAGEYIKTTMNGLFLTRGTQHIDNHTQLDHTKPNCTSHVSFRGVLDENSTGAFTGRIIVRPDAQKTDAVQSSKNLLLSDSASITPDPQLEIYADDVRCTHGATVGQLDPDALFYLQARGIDRETSRGLLTYAFANEIIDRIRIEPIANHLERLISARFQRGSHRARQRR
jgi:Fe-S cluster assembly protein SufD